MPRAMTPVTPDINVLVAASRADHPLHPVAREWLESALEQCALGQETMEIFPTVASGFLRLVTNARIFPEPTPIAEAIAFLDAIFRVPQVSLSDGGREWLTFRRMCLDGGLSGNDIPDAWIAAAVKVRNERLVTFDRDFVRLLAQDELHLLAPRP